MGSCFSDCYKALFGHIQGGYEFIPDHGSSRQQRRPNQNNPNMTAVPYGNDSHAIAPYQLQNINGTSNPNQPYARNINDVNNAMISNAPISTYPTYQQSNLGFFVKYELKEEIGVGSTSKCFRCIRWSDRKEFAAKIIEKKEIESTYSGMLDQCAVEIQV